MSSPQATRNGSALYPASDGELNIDDRLHQEMQRLAAINQELLSTVRPDSEPAFELPQESEELALLRAANAELRARVKELEQALQAAGPAADGWADRQKEYEALLEEKSEVIRSLHLKIQEVQGTSSSTSPPADESETHRLKNEMEEQRRQLEEDEESVMQQMRQMEMAMSRDRAELARQRNEVQRLHKELNHEIEIASRDPGLRERLVALQRLQGEIIGRKAPTPIAPPTPAVERAPATPGSPKVQTSSLFRRIFGK